MEVKEIDLIRLKKTKSVEMNYDEIGKDIYLIMFGESGATSVIIPISKAFQVKRGLESAVQRFYRKKKK
jgi:serine kinase of HPr protein (carbohydrate metabolism regulator)